jgi:hypothetical protein
MNDESEHMVIFWRPWNDGPRLPSNNHWNCCQVSFYSNMLFEIPCAESKVVPGKIHLNEPTILPLLSAHVEQSLLRVIPSMSLDEGYIFLLAEG